MLITRTMVAAADSNCHVRFYV